MATTVLPGYNPDQPVIRISAGGEPEEQVTLSYAITRLKACYTLSADQIAQLLIEGVTLRTPFAFYRIHVCGVSDEHAHADGLTS